MSSARQAAQALRDGLAALYGAEADDPALDFTVSAATEHNPFHRTAEVLEWLRGLNGVEFFSVRRKPLAALDRWRFAPGTGDLEHDSGGFFAIRGLHVRSNVGDVQEWSQPIIDQAEIGQLGLVTRRFDGILYFLVQAKAEPGNLNTFQLSPTVQATRSNFLRLHGGKPTKYLEYFLEQGVARFLVDQLQSEQGARFFHKRNRNTIVQVPDDHEVEPGPLHRWLSLGQLTALAQHDNTVNMDTRSIISCIDYDLSRRRPERVVTRAQLADLLGGCAIVDGPSEAAIDLLVSAQSNTPRARSTDDVIHWLTDLKFHTLLKQRMVALDDVAGWRRTEDVIEHEAGRYFRVLGVSIEANSREVVRWDQPIVQQVAPGIVGFMARRIDGVLHFLVQAKLECGNMDILELAPSLQCITDNYDPGALPPLASDFLDPRAAGHTVLVDADQSEEGGRFYREANRNMVLLASDDFAVDDPRFCWLSLHQLKEFVRFNNYVNVEARSLLSLLRLV